MAVVPKKSASKRTCKKIMCSVGSRERYNLKLDTEPLLSDGIRICASELVLIGRWVFWEGVWGWVGGESAAGGGVGGAGGRGEKSVVVERR